MTMQTMQPQQMPVYQQQVVATQQQLAATQVPPPVYNQQQFNAPPPSYNTMTTQTQFQTLSPPQFHQQQPQLGFAPGYGQQQQMPQQQPVYNNYSGGY